MMIQNSESDVQIQNWKSDDRVLTKSKFLGRSSQSGVLASFRKQLAIAVTRGSLLLLGIRCFIYNY